MKAAGQTGRLHDAQQFFVVAHAPGAETFAEIGVEVDFLGHVGPEF